MWAWGKRRAESGGLLVERSRQKEQDTPSQVLGRGMGIRNCRELSRVASTKCLGQQHRLFQSDIVASAGPCPSGSSKEAASIPPSCWLPAVPGIARLVATSLSSACRLSWPVLGMSLYQDMGPWVRVWSRRTSVPLD